MIRQYATMLLIGYYTVFLWLYIFYGVYGWCVCCVWMMLLLIAFLGEIRF